VPFHFRILFSSFLSFQFIFLVLLLFFSCSHFLHHNIYL
jgi:hypothetical protein